MYKDSFTNKVLSAAFAILLALFVITLSIGLPIYVRPFYYAQIDALELEKETGRTEEEIIEAYDELLDFLTLGKDFGVGSFHYSENGKSHFYDCKIIFDLNLAALATSLILMLVILFAYRVKGEEMWRPFGLHISFFSGLFTLLVFCLAGVFIFLNFDEAFLVFHSILFPGKKNWYFNTITDPIILALPNQFFMNAAFLIIASVTLTSLSLIINALINRDTRF